MSRKNIILMLVCGICGFFVFKNFYEMAFPVHITFEIEVVKCDLVGEWLKKKNVEETVLYGFSDTLTKRLEKVGIKVNSSISRVPPASSGPTSNGQPPLGQFDPNSGQNGLPDERNSDPKINEFFTKTKSANLKSIIFIDGFQSKNSIVELQAFLKTGGFVYFRVYSDELNDNEQLHQLVLEYLKKGQICTVLPKFAEGDVRKSSIKNRVLAENNFVDETNFAEFENWHKNYVKAKAESLRPPHNP